MQTIKYLSLFALLFLFSTSAVIAADPPDQIQRGYFETSPWDVLPGGFLGTYRVAPPAGQSSPPKRAYWVVSLPIKNRSYRVQATWTAHPTNATNAKFSVFDGEKLLKEVIVNQRLAPKGEKVGKVVFQDLGDFKITADRLKVDLTNEADGTVIADSIRVK